MTDLLQQQKQQQQQQQQQQQVRKRSGDDDHSAAGGDAHQADGGTAAVKRVREQATTKEKTKANTKKDFTSVVTITFGDQAENHAGMQKIGELASEGFSIADLQKAKLAFEKQGCQCELVMLPCSDARVANVAEAAILIVRNGVRALLKEVKDVKDVKDAEKIAVAGKNVVEDDRGERVGERVGDDDLDLDDGAVADRMLEEHNALKPDTQAKMRGRVVNKHARHNLCFSEQGQVAQIEEGKGTVVAYRDVPMTAQLRDRLPAFWGAKAHKLVAEGNYYYDISKCGIGFHGDSERRKVIAVRLGATMPLHYQWFVQSKPVGDRHKFKLNHGDVYAMSEKATGFDWKKKTIPTLRHAAGCSKFLSITKK